MTDRDVALANLARVLAVSVERQRGGRWVPLPPLVGTVQNPSEIQQVAREAAERSRREQGLPPKVTDPQVLKRIAAILKTAERSAPEVDQ